MSDDGDLEDEITEIKATAADVARVLAAVRGIGESTDRTIVAKTDSYGHLIHIEIASGAAQRPEDLASAILDAAGRAASDAAARTEIAVRPITENTRVRSALDTVRDFVAAEASTNASDPRSAEAAMDRYYRNFSALQ
ncbi:hypothetical protein CH272_02605 [Rhodococcus sp. 05-340-1]|uniref:YbaB/EbfC family nucleoid-associated protein n=1 Tax=unclassified Rhodococcus (in: high G+C Gram-positive bacteria) TaxID=192944 RepID=UPI000B9A9317|nr:MULTISPECIES: YbaB/EbfC family nucleoid-associated protein [unclassified Rhodococcus (in: high G+C Gram-positive bacteria)]OZD69937.1 hypothetical protein CH271_07900 [Rhodococcus sp. 05-340-2]OZD83313.1 hypothetical protein CH272_02605 [Rhodococcus sp. 05-340-1]